MVLHSFYWRYHGSDVSITGDFDEWKGTTRMQKTEDGHFVKVIDLPANTKIYYKFIVDGTWTIDGEGLREGEGSTENNYILTGAAHELDSAIAHTSTNSATLPQLGSGASYVTPPTIEPTTTKTFGDVPSEIPTVGPAETTTPNAPAPVTPTANTTDSAPAETTTPTNIVDQAKAAAADPSATAQGVVDELKKNVTEVGAGVGGALAAGAAAIGLSQHKTSDKARSADTKAVSEEPTEPKPSGKLEEAAVSAATVAATNAYNASGLPPMDANPVASITGSGEALGYTSVGTAVNQETSVIGSSKVVKGLDDKIPSENTQTAKLSSATTTDILPGQASGTRVESLGDHVALAEVGLGGAAVGTAIVTDSTITDTKNLAIPARAAEHLQQPEAVALSAPLQRDASAIANSSAPQIPELTTLAQTPVLPAKDTAPLETDARAATSGTSTTVPSSSLPSTQQTNISTAPSTPAKVPAASSSAQAAASAAAAGQTARHQPQPSKDSNVPSATKEKKSLFGRMKKMFNNKEKK